MKRFIPWLLIGLWAVGLSVQVTDADDYIAVQNCQIANNWCSSDGGGVYGVSTSGVVRIDNCVVSGNMANRYGGGIYADGSVQTRNSLIAGNQATNVGYGGGVYLDAIVISNDSLNACTIVGNRANYGGGAALNGAGHRVANCVVMSNTAVNGSNDVYYATVEQQSSFWNCCSSVALPRPGNIAVNPQFINYAGANYRLATASPCRDAGANEAWMAGALDLDGGHRIDPLRRIVDMGAYEYLPRGTMVTIY